MDKPYSMIGTPYARAPGEYYDAADMQRRKTAGTISDLLNARFQGANPSRRETSRYLQGLPYDYEGMASAYALKYGQDAAVKMIEALPYMEMDDLRALEEDVSKAGRESDAMNERERGAYSRAGAYPKK